MTKTAQHRTNKFVTDKNTKNVLLLPLWNPSKTEKTH